jgi:hypothetical protein
MTDTHNAAMRWQLDRQDAPEFMVLMRVYAFDTEREAGAFKDRLLNAFILMPEARSLACSIGAYRIEEPPPPPPTV